VQGHIDNEPVNKRTLSKKIEVSQKTIQRDLDFMKYEYNAPVEYDRKKRNLYYSETFNLSPLTLSERDIFALAVTEKVLNQYRGTVYEDTFKSFYDKINTLFEEKEAVQLDNIQDLISFELGPVRVPDKKIFEILEKSIKFQKSVFIKYRSSKKNPEIPSKSKRNRDTNTNISYFVKRREFDPYHLRNYKGSWYLIGYDHGKKSIRVLNISKIDSIEFSDKKSFNIIEGFDINNYFKYSFGTYVGKKIYNIRIRFSSGYSTRIKEKIWHNTQSIKELKDGSIIIDFQLSSLKEIKKWVMQFGKDCKVLSPKELSESVAGELQSALELYKKI